MWGEGCGVLRGLWGFGFLILVGSGFRVECRMFFEFWGWGEC